MKSGPLIQQIFLITRLQIIKAIDTYSFYLTISQNICGQYHLKVNIVKQ